MKYILLFFATIALSSCWKPYRNNNNQSGRQKVWGNKPIYAAENIAKQIFYK